MNGLALILAQMFATAVRSEPMTLTDVLDAMVRKSLRKAAE